jgi:hypothetical protein
MSARSRTPKPAPASAESRTATLPCMSPPPPPPRPPTQLAFALALGQPDDQLVMAGCDDDRADPRRVYRPATEATSATAGRKDGSR